MSDQTTKRCRPNRDPRSIVGSGRDIAILESLAWAGVLGTSQVRRLHFPSRRTAERRLRALLDHGLVRSRLQGETLQRDNLHALTARGAELLVELRGLDPASVCLARFPRSAKLRHALAVRDVFVAFALAERAGHVELTDFRFEEDLAAEAPFAAARVIPDALAIVSGHGRRTPFAIEVDRGTETTTTLSRKFASYRSLLAGPDGRDAQLTMLAVLGERAARLRTVARLLEEHGLRERAAVLLLDELPDWIASGCTHGLFAAPVRAVRTAEAAEHAGFEPFAAPDAAAFRAL